MKLIPFHQFNLTLPYDSKQLFQRIFESTEAGSFAQTHSKDKIFIGKLDKNSFKIQKSLGRFTENSFVPIAIGEFVDDGFYCQLSVKMRPSLLTIIFMSIWIAYFAGGFINYISTTSTVSYTYMGFILFGYLLMFLSFWYEVPKAESAIRQVLEVKND
jgi:hypothetical protein